MSKAIIGIDLGGTNVKTAVVSREGEVMGKDSRPTDAEKGLEAVLAKMVEGVDAALQAANLQRSDALAVGIGAPGPMNWQTGVVFAPPNLPGWKDVPLSELMHERLNIPVYVDNDGSASGQAEWFARKSQMDMAYLFLEYGVGGAVLMDGTPTPIRDPLGQTYVPTTRPGHRLPHAWVTRDGQRLSWPKGR